MEDGGKTKKGLPRVMGHREGMKSIRRIVDECNSLGVKFLTLLCFLYRKLEKDLKMKFQLL